MRLDPQTAMRRAWTHRGGYDFWAITRGGANCWSACFHEHVTFCLQLLPMGAWDMVLAAAQAHADAQPSHPIMTGWPAEETYP